MTKRLFLLFWILAILFPLNYLEKNSPHWRSILKGSIGAEWVRILGHTALFTGLVIIVGIVFKLEFTLVNTLFLASLVTALGALQEIARHVSQGGVDLGQSDLHSDPGLAGEPARIVEVNPEPRARQALRRRPSRTFGCRRRRPVLG